jgi:adenylate cyclase
MEASKRDGDSVMTARHDGEDQRPTVMVIDDDEMNRELLSRYLVAEGYPVLTTESAQEALLLLRKEEPAVARASIILLDIVMPEIDGIAMLAILKADPALAGIPVIMLSGLSDLQSIIRSIELGAEDHLTKPFDPTLLRVRMNAVLTRKRLVDQEKQYRLELQDALVIAKEERSKAQNVLLNILPESISQELQDTGSVEPTYFDDVTIGFADLVGFSRSAASLPADELVGALHEFFSAIDGIVDRYRLEKLKTIGDCYMFAGGLPVRSRSHSVDMVLASMEMLRVVHQVPVVASLNWHLRIGLHTGPVIAGVVGQKKFSYDIWGESVNIASRMETFADPDTICISPSTFARAKDFFRCERRPTLQVWDGLALESYLVQGALGRQTISGTDPSPEREIFAKRYTTYFHTAPPVSLEF